MRIEQLAKEIANEFNEAVKEAECENFKEMKRLYDWDAKDIKAEIEYMVDRQVWGTDENGENVYSGWIMLDNIVASTDVTSCEEIKYGEFKKMIMKNVQ